MTINNIDYYTDQLWDWGFLNECFGGSSIKVSDIDGIVKRHGKFLVIECKSHNAEVPAGQAIMFNRMVRTGLFTVLVIWGDANRPERCRLLTKKGTVEHSVANEWKIKQIVSNWYEYADSGRESL